MQLCWYRTGHWKEKKRKTKNNLCVYVRQPFSWVCSSSSVLPVCVCWCTCACLCFRLWSLWLCSNQPGGRACPSADSVSPPARGSTRLLTHTHTFMPGPTDWQTAANNAQGLSYKSVEKIITSWNKMKISAEWNGRARQQRGAVYYVINRHNGLDRQVIFTARGANLISR